MGMANPLSIAQWFQFDVAAAVIYPSATLFNRQALHYSTVVYTR